MSLQSDRSREKKPLRREVLARLGALPMETILEKSKRIEASLFESSWWRRARVVYCYVSMPREVQTAEFRRRAIAEGKTLALPRVAGDEIRFHRMSEPDQPLVRSSFNIDEPAADLPPVVPESRASDDEQTGVPPGTAAESALVIVPGLAFDRERYRLGRGRGYYDRFLASGLGCFSTVGVCFEEQLVDEVPREDWDMRMDCVVTDERVIGE
ncbi:MAG: 5-formyltetrahydrofolate cyclo-ligase [Spirochaetes bacterium]|jgi:5-formyltetrahydrofolate cyclo-ligase|nr:5-formyltetrahydrofolate cyclo-ligase [Spirochaetota bacterium]